MGSIDKKTVSALRIFAMVGLCVGIFLVHIWSRTLIVKKSYEIGDLKKQKVQQEAELAMLTVERNALMSSTSLEKWADRLKGKGHDLRIPSANQVHYIQNQSVER